MFEKLKRFYQKWIKFGKKIANFQVKVIFTIFYFLFIVPFGLILKIFPKDKKSGWQKTKQSNINIEIAKRQF